jgi:NhaP-type Na+/H+ or K+/H+ antiporter
VFQTLVDRFHGKTNDGTTSVDEVLDAVATFLIAMFGSIAVGLACGCGAWVYFNLLGSQLPPVMEVGSFFLWAVMPYYICDGVGWSGIVGIVAVGFFMDVYIAGPKHHHDGSSPLSSSNERPLSPDERLQRHRHNRRHEQEERNDPEFYTKHSRRHEQEEHNDPEFYRNMQDYCGSDDRDPGEYDDHTQDMSLESLPTAHSISPLPSTERIHLSATADKHVRFVAHLTSQIAENAIFAYLGLFLFSNNYDWNPTLITISIVSCVLSRMFMVVVVSYLIFHIYRCRGVRSSGTNSSRTAAAIQEPRTQAVLILAGLRGAVSLALVENVPIYNTTTGEGCEFKQTMKGMTSACILFTTFVFGGGAYYVLPHLGIRRDDCSSSVCSSPNPMVPPSVLQQPTQASNFQLQHKTATIS